MARADPRRDSIFSTITVSDALAFATAPAGTDRDWQRTRLAAVRAFAAHVHVLDPAAAELIPAGLITARVTRRIPYLYSAGQIAELVARAAALAPPPLGAAMSTFIALLAATDAFSGGRPAGRRFDLRVCAAQRLLMVAMTSATGVA